MLVDAVHTIRSARQSDMPMVLRMAEALARQDGEGDAVTGAIFVAECDGAVVAMVVAHDLARGVVRLSHLWVDPPHRSRGIGSSLLSRAIRHATECGAEAIELAVDRDNAVARQLYHRRGFRVGPLVSLRVDLQRDHNITERAA
jgi:ribosomal protein S18 acetylase RimI-like enzyme